MPATAVDAVRARTEPQFQADSCSDRGCTLPLSNAPTPYVLIHVDVSNFQLRGGQWRLPDDQRRCDYLFVGGDDTDGGPWVVPVELTTGRKEPRDFVEQIDGGVLVADELLPKGIRCRFRPIGGCRFRLVGRDVADELRKRSNQVNFRGDRQNIRLVECGTRLADALVSNPA